MHVLTVLDHPDPGSLSHAVAARFNVGAEAAGHTTELADLRAEDFDPRWSMSDLAQFNDQPMPRDVLREQARFEQCDAVCMVFPLFWWGMPATLKGWIDRVFSWGWAYDQTGDPDPFKSPLRPRSCLMLIPTGTAPDRMQHYGYDNAGELIWQTGTMGYMGMTRREVVWLNGSMGSEDRRKGLLDRAESAGRTIEPPHEQPA